jgi:hypothetical protein
VGQHVAALQHHVGRALFPYVLANDNLIPATEQPHLEPVSLRFPRDVEYEVFAADLIDPNAPWRHDGHKLADQVMSFCTGP